MNRHHRQSLTLALHRTPPQGLPALLTHARLTTSPARNASATALYIARASDAADALLASDPNLLRVEIMARRASGSVGASAEVPAPEQFSLIQVRPFPQPGQLPGGVVFGLDIEPA